MASMLFVFASYAQDDNSQALNGSCLNPDEGTVEFILDLSVNCPEADPNNVLSGSDLGLHSGANSWASVVAWDAANAITLTNNGNDSFLVTINVMDYYGVAFGDVNDIQMVANNGVVDPMDPWTLALRDSLDGGFGGTEPCSDLRLFIDETPTCADLNQESSLSFFSDAGDSESCVDMADGLVRIDLDYGQACPEGDPDSLLAGASALGFHSTADGWTTSVEWDAAGATTLVNKGSDNFSAIIDVQAYYGIALADITEIIAVANNGVEAPMAAWDHTIKDPKDGGFGGSDPCSDLKMVIAEAPACDLSVGVNNVVLQRTMKVTPNPFRNRAFIEFDNPQDEEFSIVITDMTGKVVRTMSSITGERVLIERENLLAGMYFVTMTDESGDFATTKLVVK